VEIDEELDEKFVQKYKVFMAALKNLPVVHRERIALANTLLWGPSSLKEYLDILSRKMRSKFLDDMESFDEESSDAFVLRIARAYRPDAMKFSDAYDAWADIESVCGHNDMLLQTLMRRHELLVEA
jgi:hypothetical protein